MPATTPTTLFPLGAYLGNPDNSSAANEATYEANYSAFIQDLGVTPAFLTTFIDQSQPVAQWAGNAQFFATSAAAAADAKNQTPVIALPLGSNAAGSGTPDQQFQSFASGQYDSVVQGIVQAWAQAGFSNLVFRPGWEMNLQGPNYAGDSASSQADWVSAFQHVYTVLHQAAAAAGVNVQVVWDPGVINYSPNAQATTNLYPGDVYVDVVGADAYSDIYPYLDGGATPTYHDWDTGKEDTSVAQFIADPVNRAHFWSNPAATEYANDGSNGHSQSLTSLISFAEAHGKAFAIPEAGAGNSNAGTDVSDDAAYPAWLAQQLTAAQVAGEKIAFVNLWDSNGGGNYEFSQASDGKPAEAAAWANYFGVAAPAVATPLALHLAEDAWQGDAQYAVAIDGTTVVADGTVTALNGPGGSQAVSLSALLAAGKHDVAISFLNDAYGGSSSTDRNLYVKGIDVNGTPVAGASAAMYSGGTSHIQIVVPSS